MFEFIAVIYMFSGDFKRRLPRTPSTGTMSSADDLDEREPPSPSDNGKMFVFKAAPPLFRLRHAVVSTSFRLVFAVTSSQCVHLCGREMNGEISRFVLFSFACSLLSLLTSNVFTLTGTAQMEVLLVLAHGLSLHFLYPH